MRRHGHVQAHDTGRAGGGRSRLHVRERIVAARHHDLLIAVHIADMHDPAIGLCAVDQFAHHALAQTDQRAHPIAFGKGIAHERTAAGHEGQRIRKAHRTGDHRGRPGADG